MIDIKFPPTIALLLLATITILAGVLYLNDEATSVRRINFQRKFITRRKLEEAFLPNGRHFEFNGKRVINTTTPNLYPALKKEIAMRIHSDNASAVLEDSEISGGVSKLVEELGWSKDDNSFRNQTVLTNLLPALNNFHYQINDPKANKAVRKKIEEYVSNDYAHLDDEVINGMFDIVVLTGNSSLNVNYLEDWREAIEHIHLIIIQQGDPARFVEIPSWADYELYTKLDVVRAVGEADAWIFDMDGDSKAAANFGFIVADRNFVFLLDRDCVPINEHHRPGPDGLSGLFRGHANNLMRPSAPYYYNNHDPYSTVDNQQSTSDYVRGNPYSLREGIQTAVSYGSVYHSRETDALTRLMRPGAVQGTHSHPRNGDDKGSSETPAAHGKASFDHGAQTHSNNNNDMIVTVPHGSLFSLNLRNVAFNRKIFGWAFCLFNAVNSKTHYPIGPNFEVVAGWFMKKIADHVGLGIKHAVNPLYLEYRGDPTVSEANPHGQLFSELKSDFLFLSHHDELVNWFDKVQLNPKHRDEVDKAVGELAAKMADELGAIHPALAQIGHMVQKFLHYWVFKNGFQASYLPVASRSSHGPSPDSPHKCAAFTIVHNETSMMDVWLRYYGKHLPNAVWLLNHHTSTSDAKANRLQLEEQILGSHFNVTVEDLHGDGHGFPMGFLVKTADQYQRRLLRYGYKCVVLSDVDEMLIPDPDKYPGGLSQYLTEFVKDDSKKIFRAIGHILAHISNPDGDENMNIEPPIDWSKPIMGQRAFYYPQPKYNKPLVSKVPVHYKPGFHGAFIPSVIQNDESLLLFHLREVDRDFCLNREFLKWQLMVEAHQSEIDMALNSHIMNFPEMLKKGETCQFGLGTYYKKYGGAFDNTGMCKLVELEAKWRNVTV